MMGNYQVRFLEGKAPERGLTYSINNSLRTVLHHWEDIVQVTPQTIL